jgi:aspartyl-tRNA(Asn)/glutamyl-tRNA(Gln) amidotransferase subunit C
MPAVFSRFDVDAIAALAHLELDEAERNLFARQLGEILEYAAEVQQIPTPAVLPTASIITRSQAERDDVVLASLDRDEALANAPDQAPEAGLFRVPRIIG